MQLKLDMELINKNFSEGQIKGFMEELNMTYLETVLYLWFYNHVGICRKDLETQLGRPMYIKFAKSITKLIKE